MSFNNPYDDYLLKTLRKLLKKYGVSRKILCQRMGCTEALFSRVLCAQQSISLEFRKKLANALEWYYREGYSEAKTLIKDIRTIPSEEEENKIRPAQKE